MAVAAVITAPSARSEKHHSEPARTLCGGVKIAFAMKGHRLREDSNGDILVSLDQMIPTQHPIRQGVFYVHIEKHRNYTPDAGRWTISEIQERDSFSNALAAGWVGSIEGWGLHIVSGIAAYLGFDRHNALSFVAKFIDTGSTGIWHGFPKAPSDVPDPSTLNSWLQNATLRKKTIKLLALGRPCGL